MKRVGKRAGAYLLAAVNSCYHQIQKPPRTTSIFQRQNQSKNKYEHRNYLGGLMKLGIKREKIGDIIIHDNFCQVIVDNSICDFLTLNLNKVSRI